MFYPSNEIYKIGLRGKKNTYLKKSNDHFLFFPFMLLSLSLSLSVNAFLWVVGFFFFIVSAVCKQAIYCTVCLWGEEGSGTLWTAEGATHQQEEVKVNTPLSATMNENPKSKLDFLFWKKLLGNTTILHSLMASMSMAVVTSSNTLLARQLLW